MPLVSYKTATLDRKSNAFECLQQHAGFAIPLQILVSSLLVVVAVTLVEFRLFLHASSRKL
jgi:hypothetical protein